jgi:hypothetical protein
MKIKLRENKDYSDISFSSYSFSSYRRKEVAKGDILTSRKKLDKSSPFEIILEYFRNKNFPNLPPRYKCVYMFDLDDYHKSERFVDLDEMKYQVDLKPLSQVYRYSHNYSTEAMSIKGFWDVLSKPIDSFDKETILQFEKIANLYWSGAEYPEDNLWEYLTLKAEVLAVEESF